MDSTTPPTKRFLATGVVTASLLILFSAVAGAEIYKSVDAQGNVIFSDRPQQDAERIEVQEPVTIKFTQPATTPESSTATEDETAPADPYQELVITYPENGSAFWSGNGDFVVSISMDPVLRQSDQLVVLLDGNPVGEPTTATAIPLSTVDRGTHTIAVQVINLQSEVIQTSDAVTFTLQRPSVLPAKPAPTPTPAPK